jgi:plastocyanin
MAVALLGTTAFLMLAHGAGAPKTHTVVIEGVKYEPDSLTIERGERVKWINKDPFPHTVTAPGEFDSHSIAAGGTWTYVARKAGALSYSCTLHPNMKGSLQVQ